MTTVQFAPFKARKMRITRLDSCGNPSAAACAMTVSTGFISVDANGELEARAEFPVVNADGDYAAFETDAPKLKFMNVSMILTRIDPNEISWMAGETAVSDDAASPNVLGFRTTEGAARLSNFALELWTRLTGTSACAVDGEQYGYVLYPWGVEGVFHSLKNENGTAELKLDFRTKSGSPWGTGPYPVIKSAATATSGEPMHLLTAIGSKDHRHIQVTKLAPPLDTTDCELVIKSLGTITKVGLVGTATLPTASGSKPGYIDWGDSTAATAVASGDTTKAHTYSTNGTYTVTYRSSEQSGSVYRSTVAFP